MTAVRACGLAVWLVLAGPASALAQPIQGQMFAIAGALTGDPEDGWIKYFSGGGDRISANGVMVSGDIGVAFARVHTGSPFDPDGERFTLLVASGAVGMQLRSRQSRVEPFVSGGISLVQVGLGYNAGGGAIVWITKNVGVRVHARMIRAFSGEGRLVSMTAGPVWRRVGPAARDPLRGTSREEF